MRSKAIYSIVVPVFNEEEVIAHCYQRLTEVMRGVGESYELIFVDDGSSDKSAQMITNMSKADDSVRLIGFSRNFGHQLAITAGVDEAEGQAIVVIDADLQDPPEVIPEMIKQWKEGYHVVYGRRSKRDGETWFKKQSAKYFYRLLDKLTSVSIPVDVGDFRLIDRSVADVMTRVRERHRFVRGLISWVGFRQTAVEYHRHERHAGETKYPLRKMVSFALNAITSFSHQPLRLATYLGFATALCAFGYMGIVLYQRLILGTTVPGWPSLIIVNLLFGSINLLIMGIMGEYLARVFDEVKQRPLYIISEKQGFDEVSVPAPESRVAEDIEVS